jgi:hypothetical protein
MIINSDIQGSDPIRSDQVYFAFFSRMKLNANCTSFGIVSGRSKCVS